MLGLLREERQSLRVARDHSCLKFLYHKLYKEMRIRIWTHFKQLLIVHLLFHTIQDKLKVKYSTLMLFIEHSGQVSQPPQLVCNRQYYFEVKHVTDILGVTFEQDCLVNLSSLI